MLVLPLILILYFISAKGLSVINWSFLTQLPKPAGEIGGGISNALVGSFMLIGLAALISIPLGVVIGIFLSETKKGKLAQATRVCVEIIQGIPSIVIGIVAYIWIVTPLGGFSALSGGVALGLMMIPLVIRSTEETLSLIPHSLKEASLSLGVPYYRTIIKVILPAGLSGILTGILLGVARVLGETAPLLFTAFGNPFMNTNILKPVNSLPLLIYNYATSPYPDWQAIAWGASFVLIVSVLSLSLITRMLVRK